MCKKHISTLSKLWSHFQVIHRLHKNSQYRCGEEICIRIFPNIKSYRRHWNLVHCIMEPSNITLNTVELEISNTPHKNVSIIHHDSVQLVIPDLPSNNIVVRNRSNNYQKVISVQESHKFPDLDVKEFEQLSKSNALLFITMAK